MKKRIVICADGTWNRPEQDVDADTSNNGLLPIKNGNGEVKVHRQVMLLNYADSPGWLAKLER